MLDRYDANEFDTVSYMSSSGGLSCPDSDARILYYAIGGYPTLLFNGTTALVGAGLDAVNGSQYDPVVQSMLDDASPLRMEITSAVFNGANSSLTMNIVCEEPIANVAQTNIRVAVVEDNLVYSSTTYQNIVRDVLPQVALTADTPLETQQVTIPFTADPAWIPANLRLVAWVQNDATKDVLQSCNSRPRPDYSLRYYALGDRVVIDQDTHVFGDAVLFNVGTLPDVYTVTLDTSDLPAGWTASFAFNGGQHTQVDLTLAPGGRAPFAVTVVPGGAGQGTVSLTFHSQSGQVADRQLAYSVITPDTEVLIVDDDGAFDYETRYFEAAIAPLGRSTAIWDRNSAAVSAAVLENFDVVVWETGLAYPTVDASDRAALSAYLNGGGSLFLTGQDIGWEMDDIGGAAIAWYHDYLHANFINDDTDDLTLYGEPADPIGDGLSINIGGGDGAANEEYPSDIDPRDASASIVLRYDATRNGGIKADTGVYRVVYFAFGFEAINNAADRALVMARVINWLAPQSTAVPTGDTPPALTLVGNWPNPFNPSTEIVYRLATETQVELGVYDLQGRRVRTLEADLRAAGEHRVLWDGLDDAGRSVSAGSYVYRVSGGGAEQMGKMMLVK
jgi:hypothetical protein